MEEQNWDAGAGGDVKDQEEHNGTWEKPVRCPCAAPRASPMHLLQQQHLVACSSWQQLWFAEQVATAEAGAQRQWQQQEGGEGMQGDTSSRQGSSSSSRGRPHMTAHAGYGTTPYSPYACMEWVCWHAGGCAFCVPALSRPGRGSRCRCNGCVSTVLGVGQCEGTVSTSPCREVVTVQLLSNMSAETSGVSAGSYDGHCFLLLEMVHLDDKPTAVGQC